MTKLDAIRTSAIKTMTRGWGIEPALAEELSTVAIDTVIAAALVEGADRERMRILMERDHVPQDANERFFLIPVCAFSPPAFLPASSAAQLPEVYGDSLPLKET
jgi:hypothetical protein